MADQGLEVEAKLRVTLNPAMPIYNETRTEEQIPRNLLDSVAAVTRTGSDSTVGINLGVVLKDIFPALLEIYRWNS